MNRRFRGAPVEKDKTIFIRCTEDTVDRWGDFEDVYTNRQQAAIDIVDTWRDHEERFGRRKTFAECEECGDDTTLTIACSVDAFVYFKEYAAGYEGYEQAIRDALDVWESSPGLFSGRQSRLDLQ